MGTKLATEKGGKSAGEDVSTSGRELKCEDHQSKFTLCLCWPACGDMLMVWAAHLLERARVYRDLVDILVELLAVSEVLKDRSLSLFRLRNEIERVLNVTHVAGAVGERVQVIRQWPCSEGDEEVVVEMWKRVEVVGASVAKAKSELTDRTNAV